MPSIPHRLCIEDYLRHMIKGLILTGGLSSRMGYDKYNIAYHGMPQYQHLQRLFNEVGLETWLSISHDQKSNFPGEKRLVIDEYEARGPIGGILSAMHQFPGSPWLVVACDLPLINESHFQQLLNNRLPDHQVVTYQVHPKFYETTCTLYEAEAEPMLLDSFKNGKGSLQQALRQLNVKTLKPSDVNDLTNVNSPEEYQQYVQERKKP